MADKPKWKFDGVRVVHSNELDINTAQTPGMNRAAAITHARTGAEKLWAGTVVIHPKAKTGAHHHGPVESVIYVVSGKARMRWGDKLEFVAEAVKSAISGYKAVVPTKADRDEFAKTNGSSVEDEYVRIRDMYRTKTPVQISERALFAGDAVEKTP